MNNIIFVLFTTLVTVIILRGHIVGNPYTLIFYICRFGRNWRGGVTQQSPHRVGHRREYLTIFIDV